MEEQGIARRMVEDVLAAPERVVKGATADEYDATVEDRAIRVVVARRRELVITVYWIET